MKNVAAVMVAMLGFGSMIRAEAAGSSTPSKEPLVVGNGNAVTGSLVGGEYTGPPQPAPRDSQGRPDLTGYWKPLVETGKPRGNIGKDLPGFKLPLTAAGEAALKNNLTRTVDPESRCIYGGSPRLDASGIPFQILQTSQQVGFLYYLGYRLVPVGDGGHDADPDPAYFGDAQGRWEADTFIVDVAGLKDSEDGSFWIDENGNRWKRQDPRCGALDTPGLPPYPLGSHYR